MSLFIAVLASLFSVVNPIGALPVYTSMTDSYTTKERNRTALHTSLYFTMICLVFFLGGSFILSFFGISVPALRLAGGLVILNSGYSLLNGKVIRSEAINDKVKAEAKTKEDISFSPLAMPLLSGPGSISLLISLYAIHDSWDKRGIIIGVLFTLGLIIYIMLLSAPYIARLLGEAGMKAVTRIMGFIVMAIACEYIVSGAMNLINKH
ncbi:MAG: NAAT family transporter [Saprospiraceae bacterium]|jgi:multiple antibiotic resistance protein|nr:NAAT family transporter [Saprospiraceae bacterium]MCO5248389.1 MarC family protein [Chitinophagales bacterium]MCB0605564.1 NAAT family transporter [Saprospiraceae bacterium]MCO5277982.1 MarC family protein [Saprospiraceae bacterium]HMT77367.1 MarC family protein [Saprospiraceae bacterium]